MNSTLLHCLFEFRAYVTIPLELRFEALNKNYSIGVKLIAAE